MPGLFSTLNIAKSGIQVQQYALEVSSHNISNANTDGYTRQSVNVEANTPYSNPTLNSASGPGQLGTGAIVTDIDRIRDNFLDYQVRNELSSEGKYSIRDSYLYQVENIFNEPSDTGISTLLGNFFSSWQELSKSPDSSSSRTVVAEQTATLAESLNETYDKLINLKEDSATEIQNNIFDVNSKLNQIDALNKQIVSVQISGSSPNDLLDKRDLLLDELSSSFNIDIDKKSFSAVDVSPKDNKGISNAYLVKAEDNEDVNRFSYVSSIEKDETDITGETYNITYYKLGDATKESSIETIQVTGITDEKYEELDNTRVLWADSEGFVLDKDGNQIAGTVDYDDLAQFKSTNGEFYGQNSIQNDINEYVDDLNKMAQTLAYTVNAVHSGQSDETSDKMPFFVNSDIAEYNSSNEMTNLNDILDGESSITAGNISINEEILSDVMNMKTRTHDNEFNYATDNDIDGELDGERALAIAKLKNSFIRIQDIGTTINSRSDLFDSSIGDVSLSNNGMTLSSNVDGMKIDTFYNNTVDILGIQKQEANRMLTNQESLLDGFEVSRQSVSGVSLDEEMANIIQFQYAYQASAKVISTIDELLNTLVNGII